MANEVFEAVRTLMAIREYADRPLPADAARRIVEAGHDTASASNVQPWHFVLVRERDALRKLGSLIRTGPYLANAAAALWAAEAVKTLRAGVERADAAIRSGHARAVLEALRSGPV